VQKRQKIVSLASTLDLGAGVPQTLGRGTPRRVLAGVATLAASGGVAALMDVACNRSSRSATPSTGFFAAMIRAAVDRFQAIIA
jgi:hypothetical protein